MASDSNLAGQVSCGDTRVQLLLNYFDVSGARVLELGPLESARSFMLARAGAASVPSECTGDRGVGCGEGGSLKKWGGSLKLYPDVS